MLRFGYLTFIGCFGLVFMTAVGGVEAHGSVAHNKSSRRLYAQADQKSRLKAELMDCVVTIDHDNRVSDIIGSLAGTCAKIKEPETIKSVLKTLPSFCRPFSVWKYVSEQYQNDPVDLGPAIDIAFSQRNHPADGYGPLYQFSLYVYKHHGQYWLSGGGAAGGMVAVPAQSVLRFEHLIHTAVTHVPGKPSTIKLPQHYGD